MKSEPGPPMTLGNAAAAQVRFIVWCLECRYQAEPDPAEMARRYGPETPVADWPISGSSVPVAGAAEGVSPFGGVTKSIWW
jgi:hypothetical protein